jgi:sulfur transfer protein SufE
MCVKVFLLEHYCGKNKDQIKHLSAEEWFCKLGRPCNMTAVTVKTVM